MENKKMIKNMFLITPFWLGLKTYIRVTLNPIGVQEGGKGVRFKKCFLPKSIF